MPDPVEPVDIRKKKSNRVKSLRGNRSRNLRRESPPRRKVKGRKPK